MALVSTLFAAPQHWETHVLDYVGFQAAAPWDGTGGATRHANRAVLCGASLRSPIVVAFVLPGDTAIYIGHSPSEYTPDPLQASPFDNSLVVLVGNDFMSVTPMALVDSATYRCTDANVYDVAYLTGANGHIAAPPVYQHATPANGTASSAAQRAQKLCVLPPSCHQIALTNAVNGRLSTLQFHALILAGPLASAVPAEVAAYEPVSHWWCLACHYTAGAVAPPSGIHNTCVTVTALVATLPGHFTGLSAHVARITAPLIARLGHGGPALSNATFNQGMLVLSNSMQETRDAQAALAIRNDVKTVRAERGEAVLQELFNLCYVNDETQLPPLWRIVANSNKNNAIAQVGAAISTRFLAANVGLSPDSIPVVTTQLFDQLFKRNMFGGSGTVMGEGLTPFAIVCPNHAEARAAQLASAAADRVASPDYADAVTIMTTDVRLPTNPYQAMEKLIGWSVLLDCVIGANHTVAVATHNFAMVAGASITQYCNGAVELSVAMPIIIAFLFEAQQKLFYWINRAMGATTAASRPTIPNYDDILQAFTMRTFRGAYPDNWTRHITPAVQQKAAAGATGTTKTPSKPANNNQPDAVLQKRYTDSGSPGLTAMMGGAGSEIIKRVPKAGNDAVCLAWTLQGKCRTGCERKANHRQLGTAVTTALHKFLDGCPGIKAPGP
jgi:hypothetical protein